MVTVRAHINQPEKLQYLAQSFRKDVLKMVMMSHEGHLGGAFSCMEILTVLYFYTMKINPALPDWEDRDRFILSKGHACFALYVVLAHRNFFSPDLLDNVIDNKSMFYGHPSRGSIPGIEVSTGSLGHGLSIGVGMALAEKKNKTSARVFVLLGDGECQEGSVWEAAMLAAANNLDNLIVIIDVNSLQAIGKTADIIPMEPFADKWAAFGWSTCQVDGHDCEAMMEILPPLHKTSGLPLAIIARTTKGKGVSYMESVPMWHSRVPTKKEFRQAMKELNLTLKTA